jgi:hypothetical protein
VDKDKVADSFELKRRSAVIKKGVLKEYSELKGDLLTPLSNTLTPTAIV